MIKAILFDADGVLLKAQRYFADVAAEKYNLPLEKITPFFQGPFQKCQTGEADIKEILPPYLSAFQWPKSLDEYLTEWFQNGTQIDEPVLRYVEDLRSKGIKCYLATDQEKYRAEYIKNDLGLLAKLDGLFFSCDLKSTKSDAKFFNQIIERLGIEPNYIIYFDDDMENVEVAQSVGINAHFFENVDQAGKVIEENV